jgi:hypothetical protein
LVDARAWPRASTKLCELEKGGGRRVSRELSATGERIVMHNELRPPKFT